jgi:hypothetical protein
MFWSVE